MKSMLHVADMFIQKPSRVVCHLWVKASFPLLGKLHKNIGTNTAHIHLGVLLIEVV